jgi:hypothetical protein
LEGKETLGLQIDKYRQDGGIFLFSGG